jgi:hypothetical protein
MRDFFRLFARPEGILVLVLLSSGFLIFPPLLVVLEIVLGMFVWWFIATHPLKKSDGGDQFPTLLLWLGFLVFAVVWAVPFFLSSAPFGYDTGIYRYELQDSFHALPEYVSQVFLGLPLLTNVLQLFGVPIDAVIGGFYWFVVLLLPLSMIFFAEKIWGRRVTFFVLLLFCISLVQWKASTMMLFKQELALALSFFALWLFSLRSRLILLVLPFIMLLQPLEAFLLGVSLVVFGFPSLFRSSSERKYLVFLALSGIVLGGSLLLLDTGFWSGAWSLFSDGILDPDGLESSLRSGVFLSLSDYGYQSALFFVFGVLGIVLSWKDGRSNLLKGYCLILFLWIAFGFFFYERMLISFNTVLLLFSAFGLSRFYQILTTDRFGKFLGVLLAIGMVFPFGYTLQRYEPLVSHQELSSIQTFCATLAPNTYVAATDSFYGPWLRGYCPDQQVFGPGLFEDNQWSRSEWQAFWRGEVDSQQELLSRYDREVYFYSGKRQPQIEFSPDLFQWIEGGWWIGRGERL